MPKNDCYSIWWDIFTEKSCGDCYYKKIMHEKFLYPSPFYKGTNYKIGQGILFIGQNPGWPHYRIKQKHFCNDMDYLEIQNTITMKYRNNLENFREEFDFIMEAMAWELRVDPVWQGVIKSGVDVKLKDIAFTNIVKCPTEDNKRDFTSDIVDSCVNKYLVREIEILNPALLVFIGKEIIDGEKGEECIIEKYRNIIGDRQWDFLKHTSLPFHHKENRESGKGKDISDKIRRVLQMI